MRENKFPQFILSLPVVIGSGKVEQNCIMDHAIWFYKQFLILSPLLPLSLFPPLHFGQYGGAEDPIRIPVQVLFFPFSPL